VSTEEEWKRYIDRGCLVEKAVEQLRYNIYLLPLPPSPGWNINIVLAKIRYFFE